jgi:hypothetical protein
MFGAMPTPVVAHAHDDRAAAAPRGDADATLLARVLGRVVEQVADHLREARRIGVEVDRLARHAHEQQLALRIDHGHGRLDRLADDRLQLHALPLELHLALRDARHVEQVVDEARELRDLAVDDLARHAQRRVAVVRAAEDLARVADRRERVAQLVRQHREEHVLAPVRLLQLGEQAAQLVLALALAQRGLGRGDERRHAHRTLEQDHVAERLHRLRRGHGVGGRRA